MYWIIANNSNHKLPSRRGFIAVHCYNFNISLISVCLRLLNFFRQQIKYSLTYETSIQ